MLFRNRMSPFFITVRISWLRATECRASRASAWRRVRPGMSGVRGSFGAPVRRRRETLRRTLGDWW